MVSDGSCLLACMILMIVCCCSNPVARIVVPKKQVACTMRCKCQGCENSYGTGGKGLQGNGDPGGPSGQPNGAPDGGDGSPGGSGESAVVIDEELQRPTEAGVAENVAAIDPLDPGHGNNW